MFLFCVRGFSPCVFVLCERISSLCFCFVREDLFDLLLFSSSPVFARLYQAWKKKMSASKNKTVRSN